MNIKALTGLAVVVALLMGIAVVSLAMNTNAPDTVLESTTSVGESHASAVNRPGSDVTRGGNASVATQVEISHNNVDTKVKIK